MTKLQYLDNYIEKRLLKENSEREHTRSGKLSAGKLGQPLQWAVLHAIGMPSKTLEEYVIRKFARGNHVEDWLISMMPGLVNKQKFVEYRNVVGFADALVDMRDWNLEIDTIPHEIKSATNMAFKWIIKSGPKEGHIKQGALYALALGAEYFALDYVASDDYRVETFLLKTADYKAEIDKTIDEYDDYRARGVIPEFKEVEKWNSTPKYAPYPQFVGLSSQEIEEILEKDYPEQYKVLKGMK